MADAIDSAKDFQNRFDKAQEELAAKFAAEKAKISDELKADVTAARTALKEAEYRLLLFTGKKPSTKAGGAAKTGASSLTEAVIASLQDAPSNNLDFAGLQAATQAKRGTERKTREDHLNEAIKELTKAGKIVSKGDNYKLK